MKRQRNLDETPDTRTSIIEAGIYVFGAFGFEQATTRTIAKEAKVNLGLLQYYFGGKEPLYLACAEHITDLMEPKLSALLSRTRDTLPADEAPSEQHRQAFRATFLSLCDALLQSDGPTYWLMFVNREQMNPGPAFELLYSRVVERLITILSLPVGRLLRLRHDTAHVRLVTIAVLGTIFIFQRAPSIALRALKWPDLKGERLVELRELLVFHVLEGITSPDERGDPSTGPAM